MTFQTARRRIDTRARIYEVYNKPLVVLESFVNHETTNVDATNNGHKRKQQIIVYHQWRYSFMKQKKYQRKRMIVTVSVITPIATAPHLIGIQMQQVYP
jgi:hypothetical protein